MSQLKYHESVFVDLGIDPILSPQQEAFISEREGVCGIRFPAAVTEWMSIQGVENLFYQKTNNDFLPSTGGGPDWSKSWMIGDPDEVKDGYLCVASENQGVVHWYVRLDEGEDPPVYHDDGGRGDWDELPLSDIDWVRVSDTYSNFIHQMVIQGISRPQ